MKNNIQLEVKINSKNAIGKIEKAIELTKQLETAFNGLKNIEINMEVVNVKKKWWKFWE